ncbi:hypothetical protein ACOME3_002824 [Neoechinorhynchus agilis]
MYQGIYNGRKVHQQDLTNVINRAVEHKVGVIIVTGTNLKTTQEAISLATSNSLVAGLRIDCIYKCIMSTGSILISTKVKSVKKNVLFF